MSVNSDAIFVNGNRPTPLDRAAQAFCEICSRADAPTINGRPLGHGLPPRPISVRELVELLPLLQPVARDVVWRELVRLVRASGDPWPTVAVGLALPGLRTAAARLVRDYSGDPEDLDSELVTAFYEPSLGPTSMAPWSVRSCERRPTTRSAGCGTAPWPTRPAPEISTPCPSLH